VAAVGGFQPPELGEEGVGGGSTSRAGGFKGDQRKVRVAGLEGSPAWDPRRRKSTFPFRRRLGEIHGWPLGRLPLVLSMTGANQHIPFACDGEDRAWPPAITATWGGAAVAGACDGEDGA
jgi:hypothetical protein